MAMRITTAFFSAALLIAGCGKSEEKPAAQPVPEGEAAKAQAVEGAAGSPTMGAPGAEKAPGDAGARGAAAGAGQPATGPVQAAMEPAPNAVVEIIEFSDFQCPFCSRVEPTLKELKSTYGDKLKVTFLQQPLPFHQNARPAALAAEAARNQGKIS